MTSHHGTPSECTVSRTVSGAATTMCVSTSDRGAEAENCRRGSAFAVGQMDARIEGDEGKNGARRGREARRDSMARPARRRRWTQEVEVVFQAKDGSWHGRQAVLMEVWNEARVEGATRRVTAAER